MSPICMCIFCGSKLSVRADRCVQAMLYHNSYGSLPALHYTRYCRKKGCSFQQHYGYFTEGDSSQATYNDDALSLPYFMCSRKTAFSINILKKLDFECLIGQVSYKQCADIYNNYHGYESTDLEPRYVQNQIHVLFCFVNYSVFNNEVPQKMHRIK